jgi:hypothetical protein
MVKERERVNLSLIFDTPLLILLLSKRALLSQGRGFGLLQLGGLGDSSQIFRGVDYTHTLSD